MNYHELPRGFKSRLNVNRDFHTRQWSSPMSWGLEHSMTPKNHQGHTEHCSFRNLQTSCQGPYMLTKVNEMSKLIRKRGESQDIAWDPALHQKGMNSYAWTLRVSWSPFFDPFFWRDKHAENCWSWPRCYWRIPPSNPFPTKLQRLNLGIGCPGITIISLNRCSRKKKKQLGIWFEATKSSCACTSSIIKPHPGWFDHDSTSKTNKHAEQLSLMMEAEQNTTLHRHSKNIKKANTCRTKEQPLFVFRKQESSCKKITCEFWLIDTDTISKLGRFSYFLSYFPKDFPPWPWPRGFGTWAIPRRRRAPPPAVPSADPPGPWRNARHGPQGTARQSPRPDGAGPVWSSDMPRRSWTSRKWMVRSVR